MSLDSNVEKILQNVKDGTLSVKEAELLLKKDGSLDMGFANLDSGRLSRTGFPEVVFCQGKENSFLQEIFLRLYKTNGKVLGTRATYEQYECVKKVLPQVQYDGVSRILKIEENCPSQKKCTAENSPGLRKYIAVCTAGTADIPVAEEACQTAEFFGTPVERIFDVGVSGLHRLMAKIDAVRSASCVVAVAGMEGALPSVLGGLVEVPVIAVPTSVGYGASFGGLSALLTMINSCANGVSVVNIDNGYGAGYIASQIYRLSQNSFTE